ncbi:hypothetical protein J0J21_23445, partial [Vibrio vulnificus]|uniref:hypothetical protein n=1 Tax=Vibrio vulnificus TaxID=672 RepID=UPI0019D43724
DSSSNGKSSVCVAEATTSTDDPSYVVPVQNTDLKFEVPERLCDISEKPGLPIPFSSKVEPGAISCGEAASAQDSVR